MLEKVYSNMENRPGYLRQVLVLDIDSNEVFLHSMYVQSSGGLGSVVDAKGENTDRYMEIVGFVLGL